MIYQFIEPQAGPSWKDIQGEIEAATGVTFIKVKKTRKGICNIASCR